MIRTLAVAAAVSALAIPATAAAASDQALDAFQSICWGTSGDYLAVLKAASSAGWTDTAVTGGDDEGVSITDKTAKEKAADGGGSLTLLVSRGLRRLTNPTTKALTEVKVTTCKVSYSKPDSGLIAAAQSWIGAPPDGGEPTLAVYYVALGAGKPSDVGKAGVNTAVFGGGLSILKFQQDSDSTILVDQSYSK
ncbi:MAG TPA: hypothetical protein VKQ70_04050 [Caulobacteraceae bacterium]|jgi:hypothetical protein|nr:hypothetical protein [Caulobacteraceae bacterium]